MMAGVKKTVASAGIHVRFLGVRGSHPVSGREFAYYGGNTPCVEITVNENRFIIDAGSGIIGLGRELGCDAAPDTFHILLSHLHHDHISGLPFFRPALRPGCVVHTWCGNLDGESAAAGLLQMYQPPLFPITLEQLPGSFVHHGFRAGEALNINGCQIHTCLLNHPDGSTGYRFDCDGHAVCYLSDIEHLASGPPQELKDFVAGADLVIYDSMFLEEEYCRCIGWGHSTWREGLRLCQDGGAKAMAMFHLHPEHDDARLRDIERQLAETLPGSFIARDGLTVSFGSKIDATTS